MFDDESYSIITIFNAYGFEPYQSHELAEALKIVGETQNISYFKNIMDISKNYSKAINELDHNLQQTFLRPQGQERQQLSDTFKDKDIRAKLLPLLNDIFIKPIHTGDNYNIKMLLGASESTVHTRFNTLVNLEKNNIHSETVYLLGGQRDLWLDSEKMATTLLAEKLTEQKLDAELEIKQALTKFFLTTDNITNQRAASVKYFEKKGITWPTESDMLVRMVSNYPELSKTKFILVDAAKQCNEDGSLRRPNTFDTFQQFWQSHQKDVELHVNQHPDKILSIAIVSNQPFAVYQYHQAISALYKKPINIFIVAEGIEKPEEVNLSHIFDSLARIIFAGKNVAVDKLRKHS